MGNSEAANSAANTNGEQQGEQNKQGNGQGENRQGNQQQENRANRPRSEWTEAEWNAEINRVSQRDSERAAQRAVDDFKQQQAEAEAEAKGEHERLLGEARAENTRLKTENNLLRAKDVVNKASREAKAHEPDAVFAMISGKLQFDRDGNPTNANDLVNDLSRTYPGLFGAQTPSGRMANGGERGNNSEGNRGTGGFSGDIRDRWAAKNNPQPQQ